MTIIERETVEVVTERERRARVLEAAALEIEVRGWLRGSLCDNDGRVCMMGGIDAALEGDRGARSLLDVMALWSPEWCSEFGAQSALELLPLARWNDWDAHDAAEVTFLLRWRAEEIRDGR